MNPLNAGRAGGASPDQPIGVIRAAGFALIRSTDAAEP
jgi:hypothetical protein